MGKVNIFVDPAAHHALKRIWDLADTTVKPLADSLDTRSRLTEIGNQQLDLMQQGRYGDTLYGNALRTDASRRKRELDTNFQVAQRARQIAGPGINGDLVYKRMLDRQKSQIDDDVSDRIAASLPAWVTQAGEMAETDNRLKLQKIGAYGNVAGLTQAGLQSQLAGTQYSQKKGLWESILGSVSSLAGSFANVAGGIAALSDERAKNIEGEVSPEESEDVIRRLRTKSFAYKPEIDPGQKSQVGEVAQEVEAVAPEAVEQGADGLKHVNYAPLVAHTMNALKKVIERQDGLMEEMARMKQLLGVSA